MYNDNDDKKSKKNKTAQCDLEQVHFQAMQKYEASMSAEEDQRKLCIEDQQFAFVAGAQWADDSTQVVDKPRFETNKVIVPINQLIGEQRQNRISIKVRAKKDGASKEVADVYAGLIRNIEGASNFKDVKDIAFKEMISGGIGAWCVSTQYSDEDTFDQDIIIKSIRSAASSVYYDTSSQDELKRDAMWVMVTEDIDRKLFESKYPDAAAAPLSTQTHGSYLHNWQSRDTVRIADYWVKEPYQKEIYLMSNGSTILVNDKTKEHLAELEELGITIEKKRTKTAYKVVMYKVSAGQVLAGPMEWAGEHIPVVPVFGYNTWTNGQHYYYGIVRSAKDPQRIYNYAMSLAIETAALSPKDPYWVTTKQIQGLQDQFENFTKNNLPFMQYNHDSDNPGPPKRTGAPTVQQAVLAQISQADADIQATTGQYSPQQRDVQTDQSGRAIMALQRQSNTGTHELIDNLSKAVEWTGKIIVDLIPSIYDTKRTITLVGEDAVTDTVVINDEPVLDSKTGKMSDGNNLKKGKYDVVSTTGPTFATQRIEGLQFLTQMAGSNPMFANVSADLIAQATDFPGSEELNKRLRKQMIQQGIVEPNEEETQQLLQEQAQQKPSPVDALNFEMLKLQLEQQAALVDNLEITNEKVKADAVLKYASAQEKLTNVLETKADINETLQKMGLDERLPIEMGEVSARTKTMREMNEALDLTITDVERLPDQMPPVQGMPQDPTGAGEALDAMATPLPEATEAPDTDEEG